MDWIVDPSGNRTMIGASVGFLSWQGTLGPVKCPVDPVSAMAIMGGAMIGGAIMGGAGPRVRVALGLLINVLMHALGVPLSYATTGLPPGVLFRLGYVMPVCPPLGLLMVAALTCLSFGYMQLWPLWLLLTPCVQQYFHPLNSFFLFC